MITSGTLGTVVVSGLSLAMALSLTGCPSDGDHTRNFINPGGGSGQSPIMVRGGAMSIVSVAPFGTDGNFTCLQVTFNYMQIADAGDYGSGYQTGKPQVFSGATAPASSWQIDITGRTPKGGEDSNFSGIRILPTSTCTQGGKTKSGIDVMLEPAAKNPGYEQFYQFNDGTTPGEDGFYTKRYQNYSLVQTINGQQYVLAPSKDNGDEDTSEMMYGIYITQRTGPGQVNDITTIQGTPARSLCDSGRCTILIGINP
jgi:hypothetical protein